MFERIARSRSAHILLVVGAAAIADGCLQSAAAQCAAGIRIFIDPRLVPQRPQVSSEQFREALANPMTPPNVRDMVMKLYYEQNQPIQVPFRDGVVLISPKDPCIQQYLGK